MNITTELQALEDQPPRINRPLPNLLVQGFQLALRNWPFVVCAYAVNLGFALLAAIPFATGLAPYLDHSLAAQKIAGTIDVGYLAELAGHHREISLVPTLLHTTVWLNLLQLLVLFVIFAGTTFVYVSAEPSRLSVLLRGGVAYFWRFVRAAILVGCVAAVILGILGTGRVLLLDRLGAVYVERQMFLWSAISGSVILLVALVVRLWWDLVEVYIVRNAMDGERRVRQALLPALRLLGKYFFRIVGCFFLSGLLGVGILALCLFLWKQFVPAYQVWLAFLLGQLGLFLLLASRFWQRGIEATLVMAADPPMVAAEEIAAMEDEELPALAEPGALAALSEPTLRELVQKLRTEPWATPEVATVVPPRLSSESAPATVVDSNANESLLSIFDRHVTKFPLGGVNPAKEPADAVEKKSLPGDPFLDATKFPQGGLTSEKGPSEPVQKESLPDDPKRPPRTGKPLP